MSAGGSVLVVGAGLAGLATTIALREIGLQVSVHERAEVLGAAGAALGVHARAMVTLRRLGADGPVAAHGAPVERYEFRSWRGRLLTWWPQGEISRAIGAPSLTVARSHLQQALRERVPPDVLHCGAELVDLRWPDGKVEAVFADGSTRRADLLVAADGINSTVRRLLVQDGPPRYAGFLAYRAVVERRPAVLPADTARQTLGPRATFGAWPLTGGRVYWVATLAGPEDPGTSPSEDHDRLVRAFGTAHHPIGELIRQTPAERVLRTPIRDRPALTGWYRRRCLLVGDAAHPMLPTTGQGGGQALADAVVLADVLAGQDLSDEAQLAAAAGRFEARRGPVTAAAAAEARRIGAAQHTGNPVRRLAYQAVLRATPQRVWMSRMSGRGGPGAASPGRPPAVPNPRSGTPLGRNQ